VDGGADVSGGEAVEEGAADGSDEGRSPGGDRGGLSLSRRRLRAKSSRDVAAASRSASCWREDAVGTSMIKEWLMATRSLFDKKREQNGRGVCCGVHSRN
jgi:hypothetical protein